MSKSNWKVKFMRKGFEPPMPFGKSHTVVAAHSSKDAKNIVLASGMVSERYPKVTASKTTLAVEYPFGWTEAS